MPSSKRNRAKKRPETTPPLDPDIMDDDNNDLMNDLLAQLDSRDQTVQAESANVLREMNLNAQADEIESRTKQDAKSRFNARQVCRKSSTRFSFSSFYSNDRPEKQRRSLSLMPRMILWFKHN